jgi:hypothetical protein
MKSKRKYRKAMRKAKRYVAAVQACIDGDLSLEESNAAKRMGPQLLLETLCLSGLLGTKGGSMSVNDRKYSAREQMLFLLRSTVGFRLMVKEYPQGLQLIMGVGPSSEWKPKRD